MIAMEAFPLARQVQEAAGLELEKREELIRNFSQLNLADGKRLAAIVKKWGFDWIRFRRAVDFLYWRGFTPPNKDLAADGITEETEYAYRCGEIWDINLGFVPIDRELRRMLPPKRAVAGV